MKIEYKTPNPLIRGVHKTEDAYTFTMEVSYDDLSKDCGIVLYKKGTSEECIRIPFDKGVTCGRILSVSCEIDNGYDYDYNFYIDDKIITDEYAKAINGREKWGEKSTFTSAPLDVYGKEKKDYEYLLKKPRIKLNDNVIYKLHVRGFTKSATSKVKNKGTYSGIVQKISYFKELGINMVELMPAYDFFENAEDRDETLSPISIGTDIINYWGYCNAFYYAPKASFAGKSGVDAINEFKNMVNELHKEGIEVCMEFMFLNKSAEYILKCLRYWVMTYGIDAIHLTGIADDTLDIICEDALLGDTKVFSMNMKNKCNGYEQPLLRRLASYNDGFLKGARHFLKGDEDQVSSMCYNVRNNPNGMANINYLSGTGQLTLFDTVSYDRKHNEANGENNNDGAANDFSWNCGVEGPTKKRKILELRKKQIKNAVAMLLLSQGVPVIFSGDECANTQNGNNNPYCQDNDISYIKWTRNSFEKEIFEYTKKLISFRKCHAITHMESEMKNMDYLSKGYPDMSFHGSRAWYLDSGYFNRHFSFMLCGEYADEVEDIFIAFNMHWEEQSFDVPSPRSGMVWKKYLDTNINTIDTFIIDDVVERSIKVTPRTVVILVAVKDDSKKLTKKRKSK
ncbi:alpha-amylase family glycosyl hydrolase [Eubacterium sp.]|uniref:alpha-amylase family glycosyl hydrolase n=1 Tax=Eubacterium sp. TaxID=142586 RepID=UPI0025E7755B|nr:alpha-amylase family glycosyl hydrolase [Eubacterium sp.]MCR5628104.1 alpha-amylase [Eubacterium sp.]